MWQTEKTVRDHCPTCRRPIYSGPIRSLKDCDPNVIDIGDIIDLNSMPCPRCGTELTYEVQVEYDDFCYLCHCSWPPDGPHEFEWDSRRRVQKWWCDACEENLFASLLAEFCRPLARLFWYPLAWISRLFISFYDWKEKRKAHR